MLRPYFPGNCALQNMRCKSSDAGRSVRDTVSRACLLLFFGCLALAAQTDPLVAVTPLTARPGDTFTLLVTLKACPASGSPSPFDKDHSVTISGSDITTSGAQVSQCSISLAATVAAKPARRDAIIYVTNSQGQRLGSFNFEIVDIPPGPIPPGLQPQVDVMWDVMSDANCSDQFGVRLARRYFCIDVVLGNNSGYPLLIAGVGFLRNAEGFEYRESAASYLTTRAVIQEQQVYSARNMTLRGLQAAGLVIGAFAPFSGNAGRRGRISLWGSIIGTTLASAWDSFAPDPTVKQTGNLDDAALRDGKLIPNNSPVRFVIFVDRDTLMPLLLRDAKQLRLQAEVYTRQSANLQARMDASLDYAERQVLYTAKNLAKAQAAALNELADRYSLGNCGTPRGTNLFMQRKYAPLEKNLLEVRRALGKLIVVGDQIEFKQRIQVDASAVNPEVQPAPLLLGLDPATKAKGSIDFTLSGMNFDPNSVAVTFSGTGCPCAVTLKSKTTFQIQGTVTINTKGDYTVTVQNGSNGRPSNPKTLTVTDS
jgi:hypothetical protein